MDRSKIIVPFRKGACPSAYTLARYSEVRCCSAKAIHKIYPAHTYINWGSTGYILREIARERLVINKPPSVYRATNKIVTLTLLSQHDVPVPPYSLSANDDNRLRQQTTEGIDLARSLHGSKGRGIEIIEPDDRYIPPADFYSAYIDKEREFRVHVWLGEVIDIVEKRQKWSERDDDILIWNHSNNFNFYHRISKYEQIAPIIDSIKSTAIRAVEALSLDFGAVDLITRGWHIYVLEVNTAPGVSRNKTLDAYTNAIKET